MILTITPNPALDVTYPLDEINLGQVHRVYEHFARSGGKGINTAAVLNALGEDVIATGFLGGSAGQRVQAGLDEEKIPSRFIRTITPTRTSVAITDPEHGSTVINENGSPQPRGAWSELIDTVRAINAQVITVNGSFPPQTPPNQVTDFYRALLATGAIIVVDTSGEPLRLAIEAGVHALKPNHLELAELTGNDDIEGNINALLDNVHFVLCSRGEDGMIAKARGGDFIHVPVPRRVAGNPTGAGDSVVASLARSLHRDGLDSARDPHTLHRWLSDALALSAATVAAPVAGQFDPDVYAELSN